MGSNHLIEVRVQACDFRTPVLEYLFHVPRVECVSPDMPIVFGAGEHELKLKIPYPMTDAVTGGLLVRFSLWGDVMNRHEDRLIDSLKGTNEEREKKALDCLKLVGFREIGPETTTPGGEPGEEK